MAEAAAGVVSGGLSTVGPIIQGNQEKAMADFNATAAGQQASEVTAQGEENAKQSLLNSNKMIGAEESGYSAAGVTGVSASSVIRASASQGALNALTIINNADIKAVGYTNQAALDTYKGYADQLAGDVKGLQNLSQSIMGPLGSMSGTNGSSTSGSIDGADNADVDELGEPGGEAEAGEGGEAAEAGGGVEDIADAAL